MLKRLRKENRIDDRQISTLLGWKNSGFSAYRGQPISRHNRRARENLTQCVMSTPFSAEKMAYVADGKVIYRSEMSRGGYNKNVDVFDDSAFIAAGTQHVSRRASRCSARRTRACHVSQAGEAAASYYGWYSNRARGEHRNHKHVLLRPGDQPEEEQEDAILDDADYRPSRVTAKTWRQLIQKIWEVDPLACPRCGGAMKIIALIEEPAVVRRILKHLELWRGDETRRGDQHRNTPYDVAEAPPELGWEPVDNGSPGHEEEPTCAIH